MPDRKKALIAGATGVVGRNLLRHLLTLGDWDVIAVSRRKPDVEGRYEHVAVDLLDQTQTFEALRRPRGVTHVFFSAYIERPTWAEMVAPNQTMLVNLMDAIEIASPNLTHINLMHGTKWYGNHLGPFKTPAKEDDPRHMPPNFYYDQQDLVAARQRGKTWTWSTARPHAICGFATGNPMNLVMVLAVYATISKALGIPLRHPGIQENYHALYQCTDTALLSRALVWMATDSRCANEPFNITNGDLIRWENLWPKIASYFRMEVGPRQHITLTEMMADKASLWDRIVSQHGAPLSVKTNESHRRLLLTQHSNRVSTNTGLYRRVTRDFSCKTLSTGGPRPRGDPPATRAPDTFRDTCAIDRSDCPWPPLAR